MEKGTRASDEHRRAGKTGNISVHDDLYTLGDASHLLGHFRLIIEKRYADLRLAELDVDDSEVFEAPFPLGVELRVSSYELRDGDKPSGLRIGVKELWLELSYQKCKAVPGSRFAELDKDFSQKYETLVKEGRHKHLEGELRGSSKIAWKSASLDGFLAATSQTALNRTEETEIRRTDEQRRVTADAFGWVIKIIREDSDPYLRGRYLRPDMPLCVVQPEQKNFSIQIKLFFSCRSGNIYIECVDSDENAWFDGIKSWILGQKNRNKQRALQLIAAKALQHAEDPFCLCEHSITPNWSDAND